MPISKAVTATWHQLTGQGKWKKAIGLGVGFKGHTITAAGFE
jgi:hypothetical protein